MRPVPVEPSMLNVVAGFVQELRAAAMPVSLTEELDAMRAVLHVPLEDRGGFRSALAATLVKSRGNAEVFDTLFDLYFSLRPAAGTDRELALSDHDLVTQLEKALIEGDETKTRDVARQAVSRFAGMEAGRPVGASYYVNRTLRHLDFDGLLDSLIDMWRKHQPDRTPLEERLTREDHLARLAGVQKEVTDEVRRRLVAERGPGAVARTVRVRPPQEVDFMHATSEELLALRRALSPLSRRLAARLARRRHHRRGPLDFKSTVRHSMSYGGVPAEPRFRHPRPSKPKLMVVADISGSVAAFARFTLQLVHALSSQFSQVRSFVFIDGIDEVTRFFESTDDLSEALRLVSTEADVVWMDGHSDYGHSLTTFWERWGRDVDGKTTVLMLGDARNNYHATEPWVVADMAKKARHVYWLNPEPRSYWDTGDSVFSQYSPHCDAVFECRNLAQLERVVEQLGG